MLKKPQVLSVLGVFIIGILFLAASPQQTVVQSKESHAEKLWKQSGHADSTAEAFIHWDEDDPKSVSTSCAKCHSTEGLQQFLLDGSVHTAVDLNTVEASGKRNSIRCEACHVSDNGGALRPVSSVTFPSKVTVETEGTGGVCMLCHQGRKSVNDVDSRIATAGVGPDTVSSKMSFQNIHYFPSAAAQMGSVAKAGAQYPGKTYDARFAHITGYNDCTTCHNPHSLEIKEENCATCHSFSDPTEIRYYGSFTDYDGDGDTDEGLYWEIETLKAKLYDAMKAYTKSIGVPIVHDSHAYPYFFNDTNGNGEADADEAVYANQYRNFTPRSFRASYNYQFVSKEPAGYAHGGKYFIQLLYDGIEDLNAGMGGTFGMAGMHRGDEGHFDGAGEAWRHWDGDEDVPGRCARCHSATGLATYLATGENAEGEPHANGMLCTTCHTSPPGMRMAPSAKFPSGAVVDMGDSSNLCLSCHQGRASKSSVDGKIAGGPGPYSFTNVHYFAVGAVLYGTDAKGGYEYSGKNYVGQRIWPNHDGRFGTCVQCHMGTKGDYENGNRPMSNHNVHKPNPADCVLCHGQDVSQKKPGSDPANFKFSGIRPASTPDYNGDGNYGESLKNEIKSLEAALYAQMQTYGINIGEPVIYNSARYPYWFKDDNANGVIDQGESSRYSFDSALLKAAYNYQFSKKDPHGYIHNSMYIAQLLVDSIGDLGGNVAPYTWR